MDKSAMSLVKEKLSSGRERVEAYIVATEGIRSKGVPPKLFESMEYSLRAGGKRLRPILCMEAAKRCGVDAEKALPLALALEMLHTATLIHDDLPCMDDDDLRRGKPSNHALFGETLAVLAGDALLAQAFEFPLAQLKDIPPQNILHSMYIFTHAVGPAGVCGGQVLDVFTEGAEGDPDYVRHMALLKTGALIEAAVLTGAALGCSDEKVLGAYSEYARHLGSAFQIVDDILDETSTAEELGKTPGKDKDQGKLTHVTVYGMEKAKEMAELESRKAVEALAGLLPQDDFLVLLPEYLVHRTR